MSFFQLVQFRENAVFIHKNGFIQHDHAQFMQEKCVGVKLGMCESRIFLILSYPKWSISPYDAPPSPKSSILSVPIPDRAIGCHLQFALLE
jgi:hypothetical protein